jgi:putative membrane protein
MSRLHKDPESAPAGTAAAASARTESIVPADSGSTVADTNAETSAPSAETSPPTASSAPAEPAPKPSKAPKQTLAGRVWVALGVAAVLLVLVIIFIAENTKSITISFLGAHGHISEALALLLAVVVGVVICLLVGSARILQLSLEVRKQKRTVRKLS